MVERAAAVAPGSEESGHILCTTGAGIFGIIYFTFHGIIGDVLGYGANLVLLIY